MMHCARFRVNDITSHPVLPLLLTTSHHNMNSTPNNDENFCSELILWRVDPISPISKPGSGGISELARINSRYNCFTYNQKIILERVCNLVLSMINREIKVKRSNLGHFMQTKIAAFLLQ